MGRDTVKAVRRHRIYVEDDMLALSTDLTAELEEKLIFSGGFETPLPVEEENASVRFISLGSDYLFGVVTAAADMDAAMAVLDAGTLEPVDGSRFELLHFTYFVIDLNTGLMASIYRRSAPNAARVLTRCMNRLLTPRVWILDEADSSGWRARLAAMKSAELTIALRNARELKQALMHMRGLEPFVARASRATVTLRFEAPAVLISLIERAEKAEYETLKVRGLNPSGRYEVIDFLQDDMSLMSEIELTDAEMREWEIVRNRLITALGETS
jgi:hypothetical protein